MQKERWYYPEVVVERPNTRRLIAFRLSSSLPTKKTTINSHWRQLLVRAQLSVAFKSIPIVNAYWFLCIHLTIPVFMGISYTAISTNSPFRAQCYKSVFKPSSESARNLNKKMLYWMRMLLSSLQKKQVYNGFVSLFNSSLSYLPYRKL